MARLTQWVQKLLRRTQNPPMLATAPEAPTPTNRAGEDGHEQNRIRPRRTTPQAVHERHWQQDTRKRLRCDGGGSILVVLLGSPGIGRRSLKNKLLFDDMNGGQLRDLAMFCMEDEVPRYLCGEYVYTLDLIMSASDSVLSWYTGFGRDFFSVILAYDVYSQASFDEISLLYDAISAHQKSDQAGINILILGLKADADGPGGRVPRETGQAFATERGCSFAECSAKSGHGVYEAFGVVVEYAHSITTHFAGDPEGRKSFIDEIRALFCRVMQSIITTP